jgi:hypothetical protein
MPSRTDGTPADLSAAADQTRTIARATLDGFLQSDLMPSGMQAPALIWAAAFLVGPALFFPAQFLAKYPFIRRYFPWRLERAFWDDRLLFLIMSAGAMGVVSVVLWDTLFPARRDAFVLTPLPVSLPVQMMGRLAGLLLLCAGFTVALNGVPSLTFPFVTSAGFAPMPRAMIGHFISTALADAFVFFSVTSLQGIVILAFGRRTAARLSPVAQTGAVVAVLLSLLFISAVQQITADAIVRNRPGDPALLWNPAAWFLGLYEFIAGTPRQSMSGLALRAVAAAVVPAAMTVSIYAFGYKRLLQRAVETPSRSTRSWYGRAASQVVRAVFIRRPQEQAIAGFLLRAIARNGRHSLLMSIYVGVGLALVVTVGLTEFVRLGPAALTSPLAPWPRGTPPTAVLVMPLIVSAAIACGVRILMTIPAEMNARWIFQTAALSPAQTDAAAHKTLLLIVVPPVVAMAALSAGGLWGARLGALHAVYCGALAVLLCEMLLVSYRGIPLTRPYVPGGSRFHMLWALYISGFLTYTFTAVGLEISLLRDAGPQGVLRATAVVAGGALAFWARRKFKLRDLDAVPYEPDMPEDEMFQGFNLSEIHAAQSVAARGVVERAE